MYEKTEIEGLGVDGIASSNKFRGNGDIKNPTPDNWIIENDSFFKKRLLSMYLVCEHTT